MGVGVCDRRSRISVQAAWISISLPIHTPACTWSKLIPTPASSHKLRAPRPLRGAIARRCTAGRGAAPRGPGSQPGTRAAAGLPPGSLRSPARSWLTTLGPKPNAGDHFSRGAFQAQEWRGAGNGVRIAGGAPMAKAGPAGPTSRCKWACAHVKGARDLRSSSAKRGSAQR